MVNHSIVIAASAAGIAFLAGCGGGNFLDLEDDGVEVGRETQAVSAKFQECKNFAGQFRNTCPDGTPRVAVANVSLMDSEEESCDFTVMDTEYSGGHRASKQNNRCSNLEGVLGSDGVCRWQRRLCVTCTVQSQKVYIRIQTNNLPDHCIKSSSVKPQYFDYEVLFDSNFNVDHPQNVFGESDQVQLNHEVCHLHKNWSPDLEMYEVLGALDQRHAMGFALNGVAFQFANQMDEDPVSPVNETNEQPLDMCMGHNQLNKDTGMYHYHTVSPCINENFLPTILTNGGNLEVEFKECKEHDACWNDKVGWVESGFPSNWRKHATMKHRGVVGVSKDGRPIYGPWDLNGNAWSVQNVDVCNGVLDNDEYYYVGTSWHPYAIGCQGPTNHTHLWQTPMVPNCSTNGIGQYLQ